MLPVPTVTNFGDQIILDYERAIREDSVISAAVDSEMSSVKQAVATMFDSQESSFSFHSTSTRLVSNVETENWQKALGAHQLSSGGWVTYDPSACSLIISYTIRMEDYYHFNPGQIDIATGLPDDDNCLFAQLGWASPIYILYSLSRTDTVYLQCCKNEDCGDVNAFDCKCNRCTT
jgi:hypothetical protein